MRSSLTVYRSKRDFRKTAEPAPRTVTRKRAEHPFVIQKHAARRLHFDLRLEVEGVFRSWAVTRGPSVNPADKRLAVEVEDHPLEYGTFEGPIPEGEYGGGTVQLWDAGTWTQETPGSPAAALRNGELKFTLHGERLQGSWVLVRMRDDKPGAKRHNWLLIKHKDRFAGGAKQTHSLMQLDESISSGKSMSELAAPSRKKSARGKTVPSKKGKPSTKGKTRPRQSSLPLFIPPQLCTLVARPPEGKGWVHEVKLDGYRLQLRVQDGKAVLRTRKNLDWTRKFPELAADAARLPDCLIDGEAVALNERGAPDFSLLQSRLAERSTGGLSYFAFDLLGLEGKNLTAMSLDERKRRLHELLSGKTGKSRLRYVEHFDEPAAAVLRSACRMDLEGIVSKRLDAPYTSGRGAHWAKAKCRGGQEVVIGGWTEVAGQLRSLLAGVYRNGTLTYAGRIGTGFGQAQTRLVLPALRAHRSDESPFEPRARTGSRKNVRWAKPALVAEIEFAGWTQQNQLRQAAFKGLRQDKRPEEIVHERPATPVDSAGDKASTKSRKRVSTGRARRDSPVSLSSADKVLWPGRGQDAAKTKQDLLDYYLEAGEWMLPHLSGRPCSIVRAPDGITGETFFQRHAMAGMSNLVGLIHLQGDSKPYLAIDRVEALAALAQWAALELHPGNGRPGEPEVPGRLVFDLDPGPEVDFAAVIAAAHEIRERLRLLGLESFCKTSGGKGLHVVTPLARQRSLDWARAKAFARSVCEEMAADAPERYVVRMAKKLRTGRIFLDYLRNDRLATAVAPLSPRARDGAPVSFPLDWKQVKKGLEPATFSFGEGTKFAVRGTAWADYAKSERPVPKRFPGERS